MKVSGITVTLQTRDLVIRTTEEQDLPELLALWNDGRVMRWVGFPDGLGYDLGHIQGWLRRLESQPHQQHFVARTHDGVFCGELYYSMDPVQRRAGLDIKFVPEAQGKGLATQALGAVFDFVFAAEPEADAVWTEPAQDNIAARKLYARCQMKPAPRPADMTQNASYWECRRQDWITARHPRG